MYIAFPHKPRLLWKTSPCQTNQLPPFRHLTQLSSDEYERERDHSAKERCMSGKKRMHLPLQFPLLFCFGFHENKACTSRHSFPPAIHTHLLAPAHPPSTQITFLFPLCSCIFSRVYRRMPIKNIYVTVVFRLTTPVSLLTKWFLLTFSFNSPPSFTTTR